MFNGAGGTSGGEARFFLGLVMMIGGFYMLFSSMIVNARFGFGSSLYTTIGGFGITTGMILIPFLFGVGFIFYNSKNMLGWILAIGSLVALTFGVISTLNISFKRMSVFDLLVILVLAFGGTGLFLSSLRQSNAR